MRVSRRIAKQRRLKYYFTGKPCLRGHVAKRYTSTAQCAECKKTQDVERSELRKARRIELSYGLTRKEHKSLEKHQKKRCAICERETNLVIDHCHDTGDVRGLLCGTCNTGIGHLRDSVELLEKAVEYLQNPPMSVKDER